MLSILGLWARDERFQVVHLGKVGSCGHEDLCVSGFFPLSRLRAAVQTGLHQEAGIVLHHLYLLLPDLPARSYRAAGWQHLGLLQ